MTIPTCLDCGTVVSGRDHARCKPCANRHMRSGVRPSLAKLATAIELMSSGLSTAEAAARVGWTPKTLQARMCTEGYARPHMTAAEVRAAHRLAARVGMPRAAEIVNRSRDGLLLAFRRMGLRSMSEIENQASKANRIRWAPVVQRGDPHADRWGRLVRAHVAAGLSRDEAEERATAETQREIA